MLQSPLSPFCCLPLLPALKESNLTEEQLKELARLQEQKALLERLLAQQRHVRMHRCVHVLADCACLWHACVPTVLAVCGVCPGVLWLCGVCPGVLWLCGVCPGVLWLWGVCPGVLWLCVCVCEAVCTVEMAEVSALPVCARVVWLYLLCVADERIGGEAVFTDGAALAG